MKMTLCTAYSQWTLYEDCAHLQSVKLNSGHAALIPVFLPSNVVL